MPVNEKKKRQAGKTSQHYFLGITGILREVAMIFLLLQYSLAVLLYAEFLFSQYVQSNIWFDSLVSTVSNS